MCVCSCSVTHVILKISHLTFFFFFFWMVTGKIGRVSKLEEYSIETYKLPLFGKKWNSITKAQVHIEYIPGWSGWMSKSRNGQNIPSGTPERLGGWWLQAKRMLSANLCRQAVPPALLHLGNVLPNGPQNCLETTALLSLILDDPAKKKQESIMKNKTLAEK